MRKILFALSFLPALISKAQNCNGFLFLSNNAEVQMTVYDKKGKESGVQTWKITEVKKDGNGFQSTVNNTFKDEKGKEIGTGSGTYKCNGGILQADMKMAIPQQQMEAFKNGKAKFEPTYIEYPGKLDVGQILKDAEFKMDIEMNGGMNSSVNFKQQNRKVESKESVTTPAGTWEAFVISYEGNFQTKMGGIGLPGFNFTVKEWFVPNLGVVKTETYAKGGKVIGSTLITSIKK